jgi:hypothetical protein
MGRSMTVVRAGILCLFLTACGSISLVWTEDAGQADGPAGAAGQAGSTVIVVNVTPPAGTADPPAPPDPPERHCSGDEVACGDACVKLDDDPENCGACGAVCAKPQTCMKGTCRCKEGLLCGLRCIPVMGDAANCGGCGILCLVTEKCSNGTCVDR